MRYPTREYQSDSSSLPLGRSADWSPTACTPGWLDKPGVHLECYRTKNTNELLDTGLSISVLCRSLDAIDGQHVHRPPRLFQPEAELLLEDHEQRGIHQVWPRLGRVALPGPPLRRRKEEFVGEHPFDARPVQHMPTGQPGELLREIRHRRPGRRDGADDEAAVFGLRIDAVLDCLVEPSAAHIGGEPPGVFLRW